MDSAEDHLGLDEDEEEDEDGEESGEDSDLHLLHSSKSDQLLLLELHPRREEVADNLLIQPNGGADAQTQVTMDSTPDPKRHTLTTFDGEEEKVKPLAMLDESQRRLFQRLWTDEDEIQLLQGFLNYSSQRGFTVGNSWSNHQDTTMFYDQIRGKLQLDFNKNQLVRKLRRMKKKYRTIESKISSGKDYCFKSPHDQATFEISRRIWRENDFHCSNDEIDINGQEKRSRKRSRTANIEAETHAPPTTQDQAQTQTQTTSVASMVLNSFPFGLLNFAEFDKNKKMDDKWRKQQILELEVYSKRLDLIQDQIKHALAELTTSFGS